MTLTGISLVALGLVCIALCTAVYFIVMQHGRILLRLDWLEANRSAPQQAAAAPGFVPGTVLHDFELPLLTGDLMRLSQWRGKKLLLIFFNPDCSFCQKMIPQLAELPASPTAGEPQVLLISTGDRALNRRLLDKVRVPVMLQEVGELAAMYGVPGTPAGYLSDDAGMTSGPLLMGASALLEAARSTLSIGRQEPDASGHKTTGVAHSHIVRDGLSAGTVAPDFLLPTCEGEQLTLSQFRGRSVLLVFSDPECGPCKALSPRLEAAHRANPDFQILMVSRGNPELVREKIVEYGLTFPVVMQRKWEISKEYGIFAVPVAFLIDEAGIISRGVMTGLDPILSLLEQGSTAGAKPVLARV